MPWPPKVKAPPAVKLVIVYCAAPGLNSRVARVLETPLFATVVNGVVPLNVALSVAAPMGDPGTPELQLLAVPHALLVVPVHVESKARASGEKKQKKMKELNAGELKKENASFNDMSKSVYLVFFDDIHEHSNIRLENLSTLCFL